MIKFFRRVRQRLITENKFSKYLIYAIGEIILVVIGILIALQIGNLNDQRKKQEQGIELKKALQTELKADLDIIKLDLEYTEDQLKIHNSYTERLSNKTANEDTLVQIVRHEYRINFNGASELNKTTFISLESTGTINLLGNDIANTVQKYYRDRNLFIGYNTTNIEIYFNMLEPFMLKFPSDKFAITGPLQDVYWESADLKALHGMLNGLLTVRLHTLNTRKLILTQFIEKTENLINQLD